MDKSDDSDDFTKVSYEFFKTYDPENQKEDQNLLFRDVVMAFDKKYLENYLL